MDPSRLRAESIALQDSWDRHEAGHLDRYLVSDVEDPRLNVQSILTRSLVADTLWPGAVDGLIDAEFRFGFALGWILGRLKAGEDRSRLLDAVLAEADAGGLPAVPRFVRETQRLLADAGHPIPDYIGEALAHPGDPDADSLLPEAALGTFERLWPGQLAALREDPPSAGAPVRLGLLEIACGSGNDYRFLESFGFAPFLDYQGIDISRKNIANARLRHPDVDFRVGNALEIDAPDRSSPFVLVHDLYEHLSSEGLEQAVRETLRVTGRQAWLHFFNLAADLEAHEIRPVDRYHWNRLSLPRLVESLEAAGADEVEVVSIPDLARERFALGEYYNPEAVTLVVSRRDAGTAADGPPPSAT